MLNSENGNTPKTTNKPKNLKATPDLGGINYSESLNQEKNKIKSPEKMEMPSINALEEMVLENIIGQDSQVRKVVTAIYKQQKYESLHSAIMIIGTSGTGKTELIKQIGSAIEVPFITETATAYTKEGYVGGSVDEIIYHLITAANNDVELAKKGIVFIDEIDKKAGFDNEDVGGNAVLKSLLKMVEGTTVPVFISQNDEKLTGRGKMLFDDDEKEIFFDTSKVTFIFAGAFSGIDKIVAKRTGSQKIGYNIVNSSSTLTKKITKQDLIEYGMPDEFMGRISTLVEMNTLGIDDLEKILKDSKISIIKKYQRALLKDGITLTFHPDSFRKIAEKACSTKTGARELTAIVDEILEEPLRKIMETPHKYKECQIFPNIVEEFDQYELIIK